jgi:hypothetical protein
MQETLTPLPALGKVQIRKLCITCQASLSGL